MPEMNKGQFSHWAIENVRNFMPEAYRKAEIDLYPVAKNGIVYTAMTVRLKDQTTVPAINLDEMFAAYESGVPLAAIGARMAEISLMESPAYDTSIFDNYESIKKNLFIRVCGVEGNREMLDRIPHKNVENLAITFHIMVNVGEEGMSSAAVTNNIMDSFGLTSEQLYEDALKNAPDLLPARVDSMMNVMSGLMDIDMDAVGIQDNPAMVVVTNSVGINGASALFYPGVMDQVGEKLHGSYYVLPSSIHEVIAVPVTHGSNYRDLERMVHEINIMTVAPEDRLSDNVYRYDTKTKVFELASAQAERERAAKRRSRDMER